MSRHSMRERRKRIAKERRKWLALVAILAAGGELVAAPGVFDAIMATSTAAGFDFAGVPCRVSPYMPPGVLVAMRKDPGMFSTRFSTLFNLEIE